MALTLVVEDGSGLTTATVYDSTADCATWLSDRGLTAFSTSTATEQAQALLEATELHERYWGERVVGAPIGGDDQAMLFPRAGAIDRRGRRYDSDERPAVYREAIFLTAEDIRSSAASGGLTLSDGAIKSEASAAGRLEYFTRRTLPDRYPKAFQRAGEAFPSEIRSARA